MQWVTMTQTLLTTMHGQKKVGGSAVDSSDTNIAYKDACIEELLENFA